MKLFLLFFAILLFKTAKLLATIGDIIAAPGVWIVNHYDQSDG